MDSMAPQRQPTHLDRLFTGDISHDEQPVGDEHDPASVGLHDVGLIYPSHLHVGAREGARSRCSRTVFRRRRLLDDIDAPEERRVAPSLEAVGPNEVDGV